MEIALTPLDFARRARRLYAGREAVVDGERRFTYAQFLDRCDRWSAALQAMGVGKGDRVAYIAPNTHGHLEGYYAVPQIGAVLVPINYRLIPDDFDYILNHSGATVLCAHSDYLDAIDGIRDRLPASAISSRWRARATDGSTTRLCWRRSRPTSPPSRSTRATSSPSITRAAPRRGPRA